jgi:hypothetical protein
VRDPDGGAARTPSWWPTSRLGRPHGKTGEVAKKLQTTLLRLSALVDLQTQPLKGIFPPSHPKLSVQFQFLRTRQPLCLKLHINYQMRAPRVILFFFSPLSTLSSSPQSPPTPATRRPFHPARGRIHRRSDPWRPALPHVGGGAPGGGTPSPLLAAAPAHRSRGGRGPAPSVGGATGPAAARRRSRELAPPLPPKLATSMDPRGGKPAEIELPAMDPRVGHGGPTSSASVAAARQANRVARAMAVAPGSPSSRQRLPLLHRPRSWCPRPSRRP